MDKNCLPEKERGGYPSSPIVNALGFVYAVMGVIFACSFFGILVYSFFTDNQWIDIAKEHASAMVGLPIVAATAFFLVSVLQITTGKIEFEGLSFKFRGASGPVVLWIACFIALVLGISLLW